MKVSTKGRYGLKAMIDLAGENKYTSIKNISERQGVSENYLEQIIALLKKAGFVDSARGAAGGYTLAKPPSAITVPSLPVCIWENIMILRMLDRIRMPKR